MTPGTQYGLRVDGPWDPSAGLFCNPRKLLLDPHARGVSHASPLMSSFFPRSEEHTSELQSRGHLVCRLLLEKKKAHGSVKAIKKAKESRRKQTISLNS